MTAMKKNTTKSKVSPAPATKPVATKPAAKKKPAAPTRVKEPAVTPLVVAAEVRGPVAVPAPVATKPVAIKPTQHQPVVTTITAQIDVGFGNLLYIRGEGAGLSWDAGVPMECVGNELWRICLGETARGFTFKFLVNDLSWSTGPDYTAASGATVTFVPQF